MNSLASIQTERLTLDSLSIDDWQFILELVNTEGWLHFIGNRNINSEEDSRAYVERILKNDQTRYWTVRLKENKIPIGIITWIRRSYLLFYDIGFAFLPAHINKGYAYEASKAILSFVICEYAPSYINAVTVPENHNSIRLLKKMGLHFKEEIEIEKEKLHIYEASADRLLIEEIVQSFFTSFTTKDNRLANVDQLMKICIPQCIFINVKNNNAEVSDLVSFIEPRKNILSNGMLKEFEEKETVEETIIVGNIAQRHSEYEKTGILKELPFRSKGYNMFQFVKTTESWKISSVTWQDYEV